MDSLEFLLIVSVFGVVVVWYLANVKADSPGQIGWLALAEDPETKNAGPRRAYRMKDRPTRTAAAFHDSRANNDQHKTYRVLDDAQMRMRFRRQDEARYKVKDKLPKDGKGLPGEHLGD
ncbi:hypothetical protein [Hyphococcus lacteus]|uniref:Uncharacterized protein n=1 Tax=Hyphococcus lacteus TaxID=3143536 RepID=A0ABV3Z357_9PROT